MTEAVTVHEPRVTLAEVGSDRVRIVLDGRAIGPLLTRRAAKAVKRWLEEGALDGLEGAGGESKIMRALSSVDRAIDEVSDLLKNGLR